MRGQGFTGHQTSAPTCDDWLTPPEIIRALGEFDLDPATPCTMANEGHPWKTAPVCLCACGDGLALDWWGRVWLNPPYDERIGLWLLKLAKHGNGIALVFARTDTGWFQSTVFDRATALFFIAQRLRFYKPDGTRGKYTGGAPSVLVAYGAENAAALRGLSMKGRFVPLMNIQGRRPWGEGWGESIGGGSGARGIEAPRNLPGSTA